MKRPDASNEGQGVDLTFRRAGHVSAVACMIAGPLGAAACRPGLLLP